MKKRILLICIVFFTFLVGCNQNNVQRNTDLEESIYSVVEDKNNSEINLKTYTKFNWDRAVLFRPYTMEDDINKKLGVDFKDPSGIGSRDDIYLLVFLYEKKVVQYAEIERQRGDFSLTELTPSNDAIKIIRY
ncbi:hypothetical protein [Bacillus suaedae]|uniref:Lipoprotein n=1 Tax=Halalkalibacter suaedae TaxID=2822140 RepID=A0A940WSR9_9BACI|nr:hypothetical protein [Bacillus suaedae]MBP3951098.1 hypothetical protein [Bacillus suaedae]